MNTEIINNSYYYKFSENGIKKRNLKLWESVNNYTDYNISFKEKFYLYENSLKTIPSCYCGNFVKFIDMKSGFREFCSKRCMYDNINTKKKRKESNIEKYGVDNPSKSNIIKEKVKNTNKKKFGVEYPLQSELISNKSKKYFLEKYGVDNPSKIKEVREKAEKTNIKIYGFKNAMMSNKIKNDLKKYFLEKYGVDNPSKIKEVRNKAENTMLEKYGVKYALQNKELLIKHNNTNLYKYGMKSFTSTDVYKRNMIEHVFKKNSLMINDNNYTMVSSDKTEYVIKCEKCKSEFTIQRQLWRNRLRNSEEICLFCNPILNGISKAEKNILNYIKEIFDGEIIENYKIDKKEIDIFIPELKIGFEYNGLYWHSELNKTKNYHYNKLKFFNNLGIDIIQIWEDDWTYKSEIIKSMINNKLKKSKRIFARNCKIEEINDNKLTRKFLEENHIQGFIGSKVKLGLYYNNELVSMMTFGNLRKSLGQTSKKDSYELLRFCNKKGISVVGGASKLFKYFISNFNFNEIISYSLNSYSSGDLYKKLGFYFSAETGVNYFWCKNGIKYHRFNFRKDKLVREGYDINKTEVEIMNERYYYRVFDCGSKKWIYIKKED